MASPWRGPVSRPTPVIAVISAEDGEGVEASLDDSRARQDDAWWARFVRGPFAWSRFMQWWVARRWVVPRDVRKQ